MEEVWKDINLASLTEHNNIHLTNTNANLQDFLSGPFSRDPPSLMVSPASETALYGSTSPGPSGPRGATFLSLSSGPEFHFDPLIGSRNSQRNVPSFSSTISFESSGCASSLPNCTGNKRLLAESDSNSEDRRNKRMIKNRESAARSRAKKQEIAYTSELELEIKHLSEENERLRRQQEQLRKAASSQPKKKNALYRTNTAPF